MSRCQKPTSARLFERSQRHDLWDSVFPTRGLPALLNNYFEKAHGAPVAWERLDRSRPRTVVKTDKMGGNGREAIAPHPILQNFAGLPGLNMYLCNVHIEFNHF